MPDLTLPDGSLDDRVAQRRYRRVVAAVTCVAVVTFVPSMLIAGVPGHLWLVFVAGVAATAIVILASLLAIPAGTKAAVIAALVTTLVTFWLNGLIGEYFHQGPLLFALLVAGFAIIHGFGAALVMVILGGLLTPLANRGSGTANPTDTLYALIYLFGVAAMFWTFKRLQ